MDHTEVNDGDGVTSTTGLCGKCAPSFQPCDLSQLHYHITLQDFGEKLQKAANAAYPNDEQIKYTRVYALLLLWEDEDPQLPVSIEVHELGVVLASIYNFELEIWCIPSTGSHKRLNQKILDFVEVGGDSKEDLKIVYYGGHGMLAQNRQSCWASRSNSRDPSYNMVKWSGIQNSLEEAQSDVLLLLDCCSSGTANTGDGYGTTELIAACGFNDVANGVGPHSFTHALTTELRLLSSHPKFTAAVLYNRVLCRIQNWMPAGRELQKAPLHIVLTQNIALPSSIQLSVKPRSIVPTISPIQSTGTASSASLSTNAMADSGERSSPSSISSLLSTEQQFPRILLSVRLKEDLSSDLSADLFADWLRMMPIVANSVAIEAGFGSFSTLILVAIPTPMWVCLERHAAISLVGITREKLGINERPITNSLKRKSIENNSYSPLKAKPQRPARPESFENIHQAPEIGHWEIGEEKSLTHGKDNVRFTVCQKMSAEREELIQDVEMFCRKVESVTGTGKNMHGNWGSQVKDGETQNTKRLSHGRNRTSTAPLLPLGMSRTKKDLMNHLKMDAETFTLMDKEADRIYKWLTSEKRHLKNYIRKSAPYDWNDFLETSKDQAMKAIAKSGSERTAYYWNLGEPLADSPNWIAKWFLCRRFPYRDQRNPYQLGVYGFVKQPESWV